MDAYDLFGEPDFGVGTSDNRPQKKSPWDEFDPVKASAEMGVPKDLFHELHQEYTELGIDNPTPEDLRTYISGRVQYMAAETSQQFYENPAAIGPPALQQAYSEFGKYGLSRQEIDQTLLRRIGRDALVNPNPNQINQVLSDEFAGWVNQPQYDEDNRRVSPAQIRYRSPGKVRRLRGKTQESDILRSERRDVLYRGEGSVFDARTFIDENFAPSTPTGSGIMSPRNVLDPNTAAKQVKELQRGQAVYDSPDFEINDQDVTVHANLAKGDQPIRGVIQPVALLMSDINPEGMSMEADKGLTGTTRVVRNFDVEPGRNLNFVSPGTTWNLDEGDVPKPFEGSAGMKLKGGGTLEMVDVIRGTRERVSESGRRSIVPTYTAVFNRRQSVSQLHLQEKTGISKSVVGLYDPEYMEDLYSPERLERLANETGNEAFRDMADQYRQIQEETGVALSEYSYNYAKYLQNLPGAYFLTHRKQAGELLGRSEAEMQDWTWSDNPSENRELYESFWKEIAPQFTRQMRHQRDVHVSSLSKYEQVEDPGLRTYNGDIARITTKPIETLLISDMLRIFRTQGGGSSDLIPEDALAMMEENMPELARAYRDAGARQTQRAQDIRAAALASSGEYEPSENRASMNIDIAQSILDEAGAKALEETSYEHVEDVPNVVMSHYITEAAAKSEVAEQQIDWGGGVYSAPPSAVKSFSTGGAAEGEEFSKLASRQAAMIRAVAEGSTDKFIRASEGFVEEQEKVSASRMIEQALTGTHTGKRARYQVIAGVEDIPANTMVLPDDVFLKAFRARAGTKKGDELLRTTMPVLYDRAPTSTEEQYSGGFYQAISYSQYKAEGGTSRNRDSIMASSSAATASGSDFDGDMVRAMLGTNYARWDKSAGKWEVRLPEGRRWLTDTEIQERGKTLASGFFRPTNVRELENAQERVSAIQLENMYEAGPEELNLAARTNAQMKKLVGADYNTLKLLEGISAASKEGKQAREIFGAVYGLEQTPKVLSEEGRRFMDVMGTGRVHGYFDRTPGRETEFRNSTTRKGLGGRYQDALESALVAKEVSLEGASLFVPEEHMLSANIDIQNIRDLYNRWQETGEGKSEFEAAKREYMTKIKGDKSWGEVAMSTPGGITLGGSMITNEASKGRLTNAAEMRVSQSDYEMLQDVSTLQASMKKQVDYTDSGAVRKSSVDQQRAIDEAKRIQERGFTSKPGRSQTVEVPRSLSSAAQKLASVPGITEDMAREADRIFGPDLENVNESDLRRIPGIGVSRASQGVNVLRPAPSKPAAQQASVSQNPVAATQSPTSQKPAPQQTGTAPVNRNKLLEDVLSGYSGNITQERWNNIIDDSHRRFAANKSRPFSTKHNEAMKSGDIDAANEPLDLARQMGTPVEPDSSHSPPTPTSSGGSGASVPPTGGSSTQAPSGGGSGNTLPPSGQPQSSQEDRQRSPRSIIRELERFASGEIIFQRRTFMDENGQPMTKMVPVSPEVDPHAVKRMAIYAGVEGGKYDVSASIFETGRSVSMGETPTTREERARATKVNQLTTEIGKITKGAENKARYLQSMAEEVGKVALSLPENQRAQFVDKANELIHASESYSDDAVRLASDISADLGIGDMSSVNIREFKERIKDYRAAGSDIPSKTMENASNIRFGKIGSAEEASLIKSQLPGMSYVEALRANERLAEFYGSDLSIEEVSGAVRAESTDSTVAFMQQAYSGASTRDIVNMASDFEISSSDRSLALKFQSGKPLTTNEQARMIELGFDDDAIMSVGQQRPALTRAGQRFASTASKNQFALAGFNRRDYKMVSGVSNQEELVRNLMSGGVSEERIDQVVTGLNREGALQTYGGRENISTLQESAGKLLSDFRLREAEDRKSWSSVTSGGQHLRRNVGKYKKIASQLSRIEKETGVQLLSDDDREYFQQIEGAQMAQDATVKEIMNAPWSRGGILGRGKGAFAGQDTLQNELAELNKSMLNELKGIRKHTKGMDESIQKQAESGTRLWGRREFERIVKEAREIGGEKGVSRLLGTREAREQMKILSGDDPIGTKLALGVRKMFSPFSAEGAMIRGIWKATGGMMGQEATSILAGQAGMGQLLKFAGMGGLGGGIAQGGGRAPGLSSLRELSIDGVSEQLGPISSAAIRANRIAENKRRAAAVSEMAWGWTQGEGDIEKFRSLVMPAVGIGSTLGIGMNMLGKSTGIGALSALAGPVGVLAGLGAGGIAAWQYGKNTSESNVYNQFAALEERNVLNDPNAGFLQKAWAVTSGTLRNIQPGMESNIGTTLNMFSGSADTVINRATYGRSPGLQSRVRDGGEITKGDVREVAVWGLANEAAKISTNLFTGFTDWRANKNIQRGNYDRAALWENLPSTMRYIGSKSWDLTEPLRDLYSGWMGTGNGFRNTNLVGGARGITEGARWLGGTVSNLGINSQEMSLLNTMRAGLKYEVASETGFSNKFNVWRKGSSEILDQAIESSGLGQIGEGASTVMQLVRGGVGMLAEPFVAVKDQTSETVDELQENNQAPEEERESRTGIILRGIGRFRDRILKRNQSKIIGAQGDAIIRDEGNIALIQDSMKEVGGLASGMGGLREREGILQAAANKAEDFATGGISQEFADAAEGIIDQRYQSLSMAKRYASSGAVASALQRRDEDFKMIDTERLRSGIGEMAAMTGVDVNQIYQGDQRMESLLKNQMFGTFNWSQAANLTSQVGGTAYQRFAMGEFLTNNADRPKGSMERALGQFAPLQQFGWSMNDIMGVAEKELEQGGMSAVNLQRLFGRDQRFISQAVMGRGFELPSTFSSALQGQYQLQTQDTLGLQVGMTGELSNLARGVNMMQDSTKIYNRMLSQRPDLALDLKAARTPADIRSAIEIETGVDLTGWDGSSMMGLQDLVAAGNRQVGLRRRAMDVENFKFQYGVGLNVPSINELAQGEYQATPFASIDDVGGTFQAQRQLRLAGVRLSQTATTGGTYTDERGRKISLTGQWGFQDQQIKNQRAQWDENYERQGTQMYMQRDFALTQRAWNREDMYTNRSRSLVQRGWQEADMERDYQRGGIRLDWQEEDLLRSKDKMQSANAYQDWNMNWQQRMTGMKRGWQEEDWRFQEAQSQRQFGWQMEDFEENIRFASGRQRKLLLRQRERATTTQNIQQERMDTQEERTRDTWKMEDERFEKQRERMLEERQVSEENWDIQFERLAQQREWFEDDYTTSQERHQEKVSWEDDDWQKQIKRFKERSDYEDAVFALQEEAYKKQLFWEEQRRLLQDKQIAEDRLIWEERQRLKKEEMDLQDYIDLKRINMLKEEKEMMEALAGAKDAMDTMTEVFTKWSQAQQGGAFDEFSRLIDGIKDASSGTAYGYPGMGAR